jgi:chromosome segregation ATPase
VSLRPTDLDSLRSQERELRAEVRELAHARRRAEDNARRLDVRHAAGLGEVADVAAGYRALAARLGGRIEAARGELSALERRIERLRLQRAEGEA